MRETTRVKRKLTIWQPRSSSILRPQLPPGSLTPNSKSHSPRPWSITNRFVGCRVFKNSKKLRKVSFNTGGSNPLNGVFCCLLLMSVLTDRYAPRWKLVPTPIETAIGSCAWHLVETKGDYFTVRPCLSDLRRTMYHLDVFPWNNRGSSRLSCTAVIRQINLISEDKASVCFKTRVTVVK